MLNKHEWYCTMLFPRVSKLKGALDMILMSYDNSYHLSTALVPGTASRSFTDVILFSLGNNSMTYLLLLSQCTPDKTD